MMRSKTLVTLATGRWSGRERLGWIFLRGPKPHDLSPGERSALWPHEPQWVQRIRVNQSKPACGRQKHEGLSPVNHQRCPVPVMTRQDGRSVRG